MSERAPSDQDVRQHFTERAATYTGGQGDTVEVMVALAAPGPDAKALDVATGTGLVAFALAAEITGSGSVIGVDFTAAMIARAAEQELSDGTGRNGGQIALAAADATHLPFPDEMFSIVTCRFSVHHFTHAMPALQEMGRVLAPGGRLVIGEFGMPEDAQKAANFNRMERLRGHSHVQAFSESQLRQMMADVGCPVHDARLLKREVLASEWLETANTSDENREIVRSMLWDRVEDDLAGLSPQPVGKDLLLTRHEIVLSGLRA
jgi:ubiquinone/menaquinone biosynthesis C-methylase UbiE